MLASCWARILLVKISTLFNGREFYLSLKISYLNGRKEEANIAITKSRSKKIKYKRILIFFQSPRVIEIGSRNR